MPRSGHAVRAGLTTAVAFPIALADDCAGVIEFFSAAIEEPDSQVAAMFATVAGQLAQYLERRRLQADESRRVESMLRAERDRAQRYLDVAGTMIVVLDAEGRVLLINRKGCAVLGREERDVLGTDWFELAVPEHEREAVRAAWSVARSPATRTSAGHHQNAVVTLDGQLRTIAWHNTVLRDADGTIVGTLSSGEDVTERLAAEQQITYLAYHDPLTGLANQALLAEHLKLALARSRRTGAGVALLHLDVDNFKLVNDSLGHRAGDELLCRLAVRLQESIRATDMLARTGGDNFLLLLADLHDDAERAAERVAMQVAACLAEPFEVAGAEFQISASTGIARRAARRPRRRGAARPRRLGDVPGQGDRPRRLGRLRRRRAATRSSGSRWPPGCAARSPRRSSSCTTSRSSRRDGPARRRRGAAALARPGARRPRLPERVHPGGRGHGADRVDRRLGHRRGLRPAGRVGGARAGAADLASTSRRASCAGSTSSRASASTSPAPAPTRRGSPSSSPSRRCTRTPTTPSRCCASCTTLGLQLALDDFGSGYSSLSRLREMPVHTLKIDRAFLREVPESREAAAIVTAILALARALGRSTVAEGVETEAQRAFLVEQQCPLLQGFLLGRPMPVDEVEALMAAEPAAA